MVKWSRGVTEGRERGDRRNAVLSPRCYEASWGGLGSGCTRTGPERVSSGRLPSGQSSGGGRDSGEQVGDVEGFGDDGDV